MKNFTANDNKCRIFSCAECGYGIEDITDNENLIDKVEEYPIYCPKCGKEVLPLEEYQELKKI